MAALGSVEAVKAQLEARKVQQRAQELRSAYEAIKAAGNVAESSEVLLDLLTMTRTGTSAERVAAVDVLADIVGAAFDEEGERIGRAVRETGALDDLRDLLSLPGGREPALIVLGNLVSDAVDPGSAATKIALLQCEGAAAALISCIDEAEDAQALAFAVGALQNLCHDRDWSDLPLQRGVHSTFEALLAHPDSHVVRYASGALKNMTATLQKPAAIASQNTMRAVAARL